MPKLWTDTLGDKHGKAPQEMPDVVAGRSGMRVRTCQVKFMYCLYCSKLWKRIFSLFYSEKFFLMWITVDFFSHFTSFIPALNRLTN